MVTAMTTPADLPSLIKSGALKQPRVIKPDRNKRSGKTQINSHWSRKTGWGGGLKLSHRGYGYRHRNRRPRSKAALY